MNIRLANIQVQFPTAGKLLFRIGQLHVESGQKVLITGQSGRGKTTLLHLIAGLFLPAAGQVQVGDVDLTQMSDGDRCAFRRTHIAMIFQKLNLLEHLTATENVQLAMDAGEPLSFAIDALRAVGLADSCTKRSAVLSLGEQQRVAVARVLASPRTVLLADEPTSSLDEQNAESVIEHLLLAAKGRTLIAVSHDQRIASHFDRKLSFESLVGG